MENLREKLSLALRRNAPHKLRVFRSDDDHRDVAVPAVRNRWVRVLATVGEMPWCRVELLDKSGSLLAIVEGEESSAESVTPPPSALAAGVREMMTLVLRAQEQALKFRDAETTSALKSMVEMNKIMMEAVKGLASIHRDQLDASVDAAERRAEAEQAGQGSDVKQLLEAAPLIMQSLPALRAMLSGGKS